MALGTNYARTPSLKQMDRHWLAWANHEIAAGKTKEQYLAAFKEPVRPKMSLIWDEAITNKKARR